MTLFIKQVPGQDHWIINIDRVKIGTIQKRNDRYWVHMPAFTVGKRSYPEMNYMSLNLPTAIAVASNAWENATGETKFDVLKEAIHFTDPPKPATPRRGGRKSRKTWGATPFFFREKKGQRTHNRPRKPRDPDSPDRNES